MSKALFDINNMFDIVIHHAKEIHLNCYELLSYILIDLHEPLFQIFLDFVIKLLILRFGY
jgi:hypothetical protein